MSEPIGDSADTQTQTIAARTEWVIPGGYFKLLSAAAPVALELYRGGRRVLNAPAATTGFYQFIAFDRIVMTPSGATAISFLAAPGEGGNDSIASNAQITGPLDSDNADAGAALGAGGLVAVAARLKGYNGATFDRIRADDEGAGAGALRVTQFADAITGAGKAFIGYVLSGVSAANFSPCQIYNPVGSGKVVYVDRVTGAGPGAAGSMQAYLSNVALGVDSGACQNKDSGGAASSAHVRKDNPAAVAGTIIGARRVNTNDGYAFEFSPPIKLGEGEGLTVAFNAINNAVDASFEFRER